MSIETGTSDSISTDTDTTRFPKWQIPIVFIAGAVLWILMTWVKWHLLQKRHKKNQLMNGKLETLLKSTSISGKTVAEALKAFHERKEAEEKAKIEKCRGMTLVEEIEERKKNKGKKVSGKKYSPEMFEDSVSLLFKEVTQKKREDAVTGNMDIGKNKGHNSKKCASDNVSNTKTKDFVERMKTKLNLDKLEKVE